MVKKLHGIIKLKTRSINPYLGYTDIRASISNLFSVLSIQDLIIEFKYLSAGNRKYIIKILVEVLNY
jgi:hypothetical protein